MSSLTRSTTNNTHNYQEVSLAYRIHRAELIEQQTNPTKSHIVCPMLDAARRTEAYGEQFLPGLEGEDLAAWAKALGVSSLAMKAIAYCSDKMYKIPKNILQGKFDDEGVNGGFVHELKNGVHTGIYQEEQFNQEGFNAFVWTVHPSLEGKAITRDWLYSKEGEELYFEEAQLEQVLEFNKSQSTAPIIGLGEELSSFEMESLLLGVLGQRIVLEGKATSAILIRDIYDLYQYGFVPAPVEEQLAAAGLLHL